MSHGDTGYISGTDEEKVHLKDIQAEFEGDKCPKLQGKPKLFFIQACRGSKYINFIMLMSETLNIKMKMIKFCKLCYFLPELWNAS